jgi:hypothetical protein
VMSFSFSATQGNDPLPLSTAQNQPPHPLAATPAAGGPNVEIAPRPVSATQQAKDGGPVIVEAVIVDSQGRGLQGVDVNVTVAPAGLGEAADGAADRAVSDHDGKIRVEIARERVEGRLTGGIIWAYQPGRGLARASTRGLQVTAPPPVVRVTLEEPVKRTITVVGPDDRPIEGLRLFPRAIRANRFLGTPIPEELRDRLTVVTDAKGEATLPYLPRGLDPVTVQVSGPGIAAHTLFLADFAVKTTLKLARSGRLAGFVRDETGQPLAGIPVAVWVKVSGFNASGRQQSGALQLISPPELIRFESQPLLTGAQGAFQTPSALLDGSVYRVSIRQDGFAPFVSDWVTLGGERTAIPPIRLRSLRTLSGGVYDRQGRPVGGARVFLPAGGRSGVADAKGRFTLRDVLPGKTFVLAQQPGFRFQGWPVDPVTQAGDLRLTLARTSESPDRTMTALDEPIRLDQARALASRVLEPCLQDAPENGRANDKRGAIAALCTFDLDRALELFKKGLVADQRSANLLRVELARRLADRDAAGAEALIEPITDPALRAGGLLTLAKAIPASRREQRRRLLERAAPVVRGMPDTAEKIPRIADIAEAWLELGEAEKARTSLHEGLRFYDALPYSLMNNGFVRVLMRLEPDLALVRIEKVPTTDRFLYFADVAPGLTLDRAADAEQFFALGGNRELGIWALLRLCRRLGHVDRPAPGGSPSRFVVPANASAPGRS